MVITLWSSPAANLAGQTNTNGLGALEFPRKVGHDINGISTSNTAGNHSETTSVGGVRVGTDHQTTWEGIVFENDLMDDT